MPETQQPNSVPPLLAELKPEEFRAWRNHPVSRLFLQFLLAAAQDYQDRATASLLSKSVDMDEMAEIRGRIFALRELSEVTLDDVRKVYGLGDYVAPEEKRVA